MTKTFTKEEVAKHNTKDDCWIIVDGKVYDMTKFLSEHPGGSKVVLKLAGKDATKDFNALHNESVMKQYGPKLYIGDIGEASTEVTKIPKNEKQVPVAETKKWPKTFSPFSYGEQIPFGDPYWYQDWNSPYYNESHVKWRAALREFVEKEIMPFCHEWDEKKQVPKELFAKCYEAGFLPAVVGEWLTEYVGDKIAGGIKPSDIDGFHDLILVDEIGRCGSGGVMWALFGGLSIGLPPILKFASKQLKDKVAGPCLRGEKVICLAITEPYAGSDVANLQTTAKLSDDGKYYILNGEKKWITNGVFADFFTVAARTGGPGMKGISMLLVERGMEGVTTRQMNCMGVWPSGTTYITFEDVKVPVENLIGKENSGFKYIMYNFNHERYGIACQATRFARVCFEEAFKYAMKRKTFGKRLIDHPVIRYKFAQMARQIEATHAWIEVVTHQFNTMPREAQNVALGGPIALLKAQSTQLFEYCAREAAQIFGGLSYTRGGQAEKVERLYREVRAYAIPGGSEEIMLDLGIRQALKVYEYKSKM